MNRYPLFQPHGPCLVVAEVAQSHDGSLGQAHACIDAAAGSGADAIKFQTHIASAESTPAEPWRVRFSQQDATRYDYWRRMEFSEEQWRGLARHARARGLAFLSSPFSLEAAQLLSRIGLSGWKVASGEVGMAPVLDFMRSSQLPIMLSTGMSRLAEIDRSVATLGGARPELAVLQCTSIYPTAAEKVGLNVIDTFRKRYDGASVGLSDHSGTMWAGLAAAARDIDVLEVHVTFSRQMFGPDVTSSITFDELRQLVEGVRFIERAVASPVDKDSVAAELAGMRQLFFKSVVVRENLPAGTVLEPQHLTAKKPGTGIPADRLNLLLGRRLSRDVARDQILTESDLA